MTESNEDVELSADSSRPLVVVREGGIYIRLDNLTDETMEVVLKMRARLKQPGPRFVDYSQSPIKRYLTHPEHVNKIMTWLHLHIDGHKDAKMKIKPLRALILNNAFITPLPQKVFEEEFGKVDQSTYSKCIGDANKFDEGEISLLTRSFEDFDYKSYVYEII